MGAPEKRSFDSAVGWQHDDITGRLAIVFTDKKQVTAPTTRAEII